MRKKSTWWVPNLTPLKSQVISANNLDEEIHEDRNEANSAIGSMSGAQGAPPKGSLTATTYESVPQEENKTRLNPRSRKDEGMIEADKLQDKVEDAAGKGGPVFGAGEEEDKSDLGVTGTA